MAERQQSEFNNAINYLARLNMILWRCNDARENLDQIKWYHALFSLFMEVEVYMTKKIDGKTEGELLLDKMLNDLSVRIFNDTKAKMSHKMLKDLSLIDLRLRRILHETGLMNKMKEDSFFNTDW